MTNCRRLYHLEKTKALQAALTVYHRTRRANDVLLASAFLFESAQPSKWCTLEDGTFATKSEQIIESSSNVTSKNATIHWTAGVDVTPLPHRIYRRGDTPRHHRQREECWSSYVDRTQSCHHLQSFYL